MTPRLAALILLAAPVIAMAAAAGSGPDVQRWANRVAGSGRIARPPHTQEPGPWFVVDRDAEAATAGLAPWAVGFPGRIPRLLRRGELKLPPDHPLRRVPYTFAIELTLAPTGRIARARILRGPDTATLRAALTEDLKDWRYVPARLDGKAVSVDQVVTVSTEAAATAR